MKRIVLLSLCALLVASVVDAKKSEQTQNEPIRTSVWSDVVSRDRLDSKTGAPAALHALAPATTLVLASYSFDSGATCTAQGWTTVDVSWHAGSFCAPDARSSFASTRSIQRRRSRFRLRNAAS